MIPIPAFTILVTALLFLLVSGCSDSSTGTDPHTIYGTGSDTLLIDEDITDEEFASSISAINPATPRLIIFNCRYSTVNGSFPVSDIIKSQQ